MQIIICVADWEKGSFGIIVMYRDNEGQSLTIFIVLCKLHYEYHYLLFHLINTPYIDHSWIFPLRFK